MLCVIQLNYEMIKLNDEIIKWFNQIDEIDVIQLDYSNIQWN